MISDVFGNVTKIIRRNLLIVAFIVSHIFFAIFLGRFYALAPDEVGYLFTFKNVYAFPPSTLAQTGSGWITAPTVFLWIAYLPAKILFILGVPDYLSIRLLSIFLMALSLYLLLEIQRDSKFSRRLSQKAILLVYFIPSIFIWGSVGLRESFIISELTLFLAGFNYLIKGMEKRGIVLIIIGSYGLISTKNYLWACLMVAVILSSAIYLFQGVNRRSISLFLAAGLLAPVLAFAGTTSGYALGYIFQSNISEVGQRTGNSITQVYVNVPGSDTTPTQEQSTPTQEQSTPTQELITFECDYTLIALHSYLIENPSSLFSKTLGVLNLTEKIQSIWDEKVQLGLNSKDKKVGKDLTSLNGCILKPGKIREPLSMIKASLVFLFGPFPFVGNPGLAVGISSLESPLWWFFFSLVIFQFIKFRKIKFIKDPQILFALIFLFGEIAFSALVEVNLGTSFRHRSILLVPLVFLYVRLAQKNEEKNDLEFKMI